MVYIHIGIIGVFVVSLWGWGRTTNRALRLAFDGYIALLVALGLATWILLGGVFNLLEMATVGALGVLVVAGWALATFWALTGARLVGQSPAGGSWALPTAAGALMLAALAFRAATLLPTTVLNAHDDFHTYLVRPLRMLATGTLAGNAFDYLGTDGLGAQSFLHGFLLAWFPLGHINGLDAVACFVLSMWLLIELGRRFATGWAHIILALGVLLFVDPLSVNITPLYSGSLMVLALVGTGDSLLAAVAGEDHPLAVRRAAGFGLLLAALWSLKSTFVVFGFVFGLGLCGGCWWLARDWRRVGKLVVTALAAAGAALLPWILTYRENYLAALRLSIQPRATGFPRESVFGITGPEIRRLFSTETMLWGGNYLDYTVLIVALAVATLAAIVALRRGQRDESARRFVLLASLGVAAVTSYAVLAGTFDTDDVVRFSCPVVIPAVAVASLLLARWPNGSWLVRATLPVVVMVMFADTVVLRGRRACQQRTLLAYPTDASYVTFTTQALDRRQREHIRIIQGIVPPGQPVMARIAMPFHFDFVRNPIATVTEPGLTNPWLALPFGTSAGELRADLRARGFRYLIWQYSGGGRKTVADYEDTLHHERPLARRIAWCNLRFLLGLAVWKRDSRALYDDGQIVVLDLDG